MTDHRVVDELERIRGQIEGLATVLGLIVAEAPDLLEKLSAARRSAFGESGRVIAAVISEAERRIPNKTPGP